MGINDFNANNQIDTQDIELRKKSLEKQNPNKYLEVLEKEINQKLQDASLSLGEKEILKNHLNKTTKVTQNYNQKKFETQMQLKQNVTNVQKPKEWYDLKWARENLQVGDKRLIKAEKKFKLTQLSFNTTNDNFDPDGIDDGHSFGLGLDAKFDKNGKKYYAKLQMDGYTSNPKYIFEDGHVGKRDWTQQSHRQDKITLEAGQEDIKLNYGFDKSIEVTAKRGLGLELTGDFGGQSLQNAWHEGMGKGTMSQGVYTVDAPYEDSTAGMYVRGGVDVRKSFNNPLFVGASLDGKVNIIGRGSSNLDAKVYAGVDTKYIDATIAAGTTYTTGINSQAIKYGTYNGNYGEVNVRVGKDTGVFGYANVRKNFDDDNMQGGIGLGYKW